MTILHFHSPYSCPPERSRVIREANGSPESKDPVPECAEMDVERHSHGVGGWV